MKFIADMHTHTIASTHAFSTISENASAAEKAGIKFLGMTDHGINMPDAPHVWHFYSMNNLPRVLSNVYIFRGMEADIISYQDGSIDIRPEDSELYQRLDWIVVSYHRPCLRPSSKKEHTAGYLGALKNKKVLVVGHSESQDFDYDFDEETRVCADYDKLVEINAARLRGFEAQERYKYILDSCVKNKCRIIVNSDAHFHSKIGDFSHVSAYLENLGFPEELVVNADEERFINYIQRHRLDNVEFNTFCGKHCTPKH